MASMQCYKEEGKEFDYYSSYGYQKPTTYSNSGYEKTYYEKEGCYETTKPMMGYGGSHGTNPMGHGKVGYGTGYNNTHGYGMGQNNTHGAMGYGHNTHPGNHHMHNKPGSNGLGMGLGLGTGTALGHVMGFGKTHEGHGLGSSGCTTYKKQHYRRRKAMGGYGSGSGSDCSDSSDDERHC
ncbi:hypothetical protein F6Q10_34740 [Streptomyces vinaceus]|nr:hypothetical protein [Streptomyces vinaceus]